MCLYPLLPLLSLLSLKPCILSSQFFLFLPLISYSSSPHLSFLILLCLPPFFFPLFLNFKLSPPLSFSFFFLCLSQLPLHCPFSASPPLPPSPSSSPPCPLSLTLLLLHPFFPSCLLSRLPRPSHFSPLIFCLILTLFAHTSCLSAPSVPACHPSCQTCSGPSQADCTSCPPLASLQSGYCRVSCQEGNFLNAVTGECLSKSAFVYKCMSLCLGAVMVSCTVVCHLHEAFIKHTAVSAPEWPQWE